MKPTIEGLLSPQFLTLPIGEPVVRSGKLSNCSLGEDTVTKYVPFAESYPNYQVVLDDMHTYRKLLTHAGIRIPPLVDVISADETGLLFF